MYQEERVRKILDILSHKKSVSVQELSRELQVSVVTIRSDLAELVRRNLIKRTHGGATIIEEDQTVLNTSYNFRRKKNSSLKKNIAQKAISLIEENDCIILDASSTAYELALLIAQTSMRLTILTNGIMAAELLKDSPQITTILIGGILKGKSNAIQSTLGIDILSKMNINKLFISSQSFNLEDGLSDFNLYEVELKKSMVQHTTSVIALIDSSKFETKSVATFLQPSEIDVLVTDDCAIKEIVEKYSNAGMIIL